MEKWYFDPKWSVIKSISFFIDIPDREVCSHVSRKKDGALIAAAPDLLDACKAARAVLLAQGIDDTHCIAGSQYKAINDAIIKAETI